MRGRQRPEPVIPDHEVLRKIGGGSYGEVWLARGVTGAMRAVKVVRREDFEDERGFEREFEGILKYEPISRDHPGLVNILHVGRSTEGAEFYYYVMELGDDIRTGNDINPVEYEARNLLTDLKGATEKPLEVDFVIDVGLRLAEALAYLHDQGLAHRDIKPSNIIFVDDHAQLADIGLVAARGQRTFVGTEGFVPPEGPGSAPADIYGLGKVLYEMATGKDRFQFPELPDELPPEFNRKRWLALNQVICDICEPRVSKRTLKSASALAEALRRLQRGKRVRRRRSGVLIAFVPLAASLLLFTWGFRQHIPWPELTFSNSEQNKPEPELIKQFGAVKVRSEPPGAEVFDQEGNLIGITPLTSIEMAAGQQYSFVLRLKGYRLETVEGIVQANSTRIIDPQLQIYAPPEIGQEWVDNMGIHYQPIDDYHVSSGYLRLGQWRRFEKKRGQATGAVVIQHRESGIQRRIVLVTPEQAEEYCKWQTEVAVQSGYLNEDQYLAPLMDRSFNSATMSAAAQKSNLRPFQCRVKNIAYAQMTLYSSPQGASVMVDGVYKGTTPTSLAGIKPGHVEVELSLEGYRRVRQLLELKDNEQKMINLKMELNDSVVFGDAWKNTLGMRFVPIGDELLVSVWETRVSDYKKYSQAAKLKNLPEPGFPQEDNHPVVQVSRDQAVAFCQWLTKKERRLEFIGERDEYRLLTDLEWSLIAGLEDDPNEQPSARELRKNELFPWGTSWPPEKAGFKVGNLAGISAAQSVSIPRDRTLLNYDDGFVYTSPVGSFPSNEYGIYDLAGNAHEWVFDDYTEAGKYGVLRGGGWNSAEKEHLYVTQRNAEKPNKASNLYGFRVALAKVKHQEALSDSNEPTDALPESDDSQN